MNVRSLLTNPIDSEVFVIVIVLYFVGTRMISGNNKLQLLGKKIALAAFLLFLCLVTANLNPSSADEWIVVFVRSLILAAVVLGLAWTTLPLLSFGYANTIGEVVRALRNWLHSRRLRAEQQANERIERERAMNWERDRPRREREAHEATLRDEAATRVKELAQKRREDARAECDALYAMLAPEIGPRFSKQDYSEFVSKYMSDASAPEAVEQRAGQLKRIIREHEAKVEPPPKFRSLQELSAWFEQQMADLQSVPDEKMRKSLAAKLRAKYSDLTSEMVSEMSP